jgi:hypothetical protein
VSGKDQLYHVFKVEFVSGKDQLYHVFKVEFVSGKDQLYHGVTVARYISTPMFRMSHRFGSGFYRGDGDEDGGYGTLCISFVSDYLSMSLRFRVLLKSVLRGVDFTVSFYNIINQKFRSPAPSDKKTITSLSFIPC